MKFSKDFFKRSFILGFFAGLILSCFAIIVIVSLRHPAPDKFLIKGSMMGTGYNPSVGETGTVMDWAEVIWETPCGNMLFVWPGVVWDNDPTTTCQAVEHTGCTSIGVGTRVVCTNTSVPAQWNCPSSPPPEGWTLPQVTCTP